MTTHTQQTQQHATTQPFLPAAPAHSMQNSVFTARRWDRATGSTSTVGASRARNRVPETREDSAGDSCGGDFSNNTGDGPVDSTEAQRFDCDRRGDGHGDARDVKNEIGYASEDDGEEVEGGAARAATSGFGTVRDTYQGPPEVDSAPPNSFMVRAFPNRHVPPARLPILVLRRDYYYGVQGLPFPIPDIPIPDIHIETDAFSVTSRASATGSRKRRPAGFASAGSEAGAGRFPRRPAVSRWAGTGLRARARAEAGHRAGQRASAEPVLPTSRAWSPPLRGGAALANPGTRLIRAMRTRRRCLIAGGSPLAARRSARPRQTRPPSRCSTPRTKRLGK